MKTPLKILFLEDNDTDAEIIERFLIKERSPVELMHVINGQTFQQALEEFRPDIILSDHALPQFDSSEALAMARQYFPDIPFIMITGTVSEEFAAETIKAGADDYILKDRIARLPHAIDNALIQRKIKREKQEALDRLIQSEEKYRTLFMKSPLPKWIYDLETLRFLEVNEAAVEQYGYSQEEFLKMTLKDIRPKHEIALLLEDLKKIGTRQDTWQSNWKHQTKSGDLIIVETTAHSINYANRRARIVIANNITEKIKSEEKLIQSEEKYRKSEMRLKEAQSIAHISNWEIDLLHNEYNWSDEFFKIYGLDREDGYPSEELFLEYIHPDDVDAVTQKMLRATGTQSNSSLEFRFFHKSGMMRYGYAEWKFEFDNKGQPLRLFGILQDITERKESEEKLIKSNERFEMVASATNDVIWDWNMETDEFWWNENYYSYFGYDKRRTVPDIISWYEGFHPDDKERVLAGIHSSIKNKKDFWTDEYRFLKANGSVAFVLDCGYILYNKKRKPYRMVGAMLDITERKNAEEIIKKSLAENKTLAERMSTILNTLPANVALLDKKGFIVDVNDAWRNYSGPNGFIGSNFGIGDNYIIISENSLEEDPGHGKTVARGIKDVLKNKVKEFNYEYACTASGTKRWYRMVATPLRGREHAGAVVMHIDISELRRLEQERLENKIEEQRKVTNAMVHAQEEERNAIGLELHDNVNQILAVTIMQLSMIKSNPDRLTEFVSTSMKYLQHAIEENRKIAHALVVPDFKTKNLVDQLFNLTDAMLTASGIKVFLDISRFRQELVNDKQKLTAYRIAQEQCNNIIKYAKAQTVNIMLRTDENFFQMTIADDGQGMEAGKKTKGIGLGNINSRLSIVNGNAEINTAPGKGFKLEIMMPLKN